jgi:hypothetical protein
VTTGGERLVAGAALVLPSGLVLLPISRLSVVAHRIGRGGVVFMRHEPHALLLRAPGGGLRVLATGPEAVSLAALDAAVPQWDQVLNRLHAEPLR